MTSREFNQDASGAKKAARQGPVFIADRGRPVHVLLTIEDYQRLTGGDMSLAEALAQPGDADFEFNPPRVRCGVFKQADLGRRSCLTPISELRRPAKAVRNVLAWASTNPAAIFFSRPSGNRAWHPASRLLGGIKSV
jgi:hypothetical protein